MSIERHPIPEGWRRYRWFPNERNYLRPDAVVDVDELSEGDVVAEFDFYRAAESSLVTINSGRTAVVNTTRVYRLKSAEVIEGSIGIGRYLEVEAFDGSGENVTDTVNRYSRDDKLFVNRYGLAIPANWREYSGYGSGLIKVSNVPHAAPIDSLEVPLGFINGDNSYSTVFREGNFAVIRDIDLDRFIPLGNIDVAEVDVIADLQAAIREES